MKISPELIELVENKEYIRIRSFLANYLIVDPTFKIFDEAFSYVTNCMPILQEHDGFLLDCNQEHWSETYLNEQLVSVVSNFSVERIEHIKDVINVVLPASTQEVAVTNHSGSNENKKNRTGRIIVDVREVGRSNTLSTNTTCYAPSTEDCLGSGPNLKTGRRTISESEMYVEKREPKIDKPLDYGAAMIVGGAVVTTVGIATVKPVVIGTGVTMVGAGVATKVTQNKK